MFEMLILVLCGIIAVSIIPRLNMMQFKHLGCFYPVLYASGLLSILSGVLLTLNGMVTKDDSMYHVAFVLLLSGVAEVLTSSTMRPKIRRNKRGITSCFK